MPIQVLNQGTEFVLTAGGASYALGLVESGYLVHRHFGSAVREAPPWPLRVIAAGRPFSPTVLPGRDDFSLDVLPQEYPTYGRGDFRTPALKIRGADGNAVTEVRFQNHEVVPGRPPLPGLPHLRVFPESGSSLVLRGEDPYTGLRVELTYCALNDLPVIGRSVRLINAGDRPLVIERAFSASLDLPVSRFDAVTLNGAWGRERHLTRVPLGPGVRAIQSGRGASGHQANPFLALADPDATEEHGEVRALSWLYSGNFWAGAEVSQFGTTRLQIGLNPEEFCWRLEPGEEFVTPEAVLAFSSAGFQGMSDTFHDLVREHVMPESWGHRERPIVLNNWEATYFQFTEPKLLELATVAADVGVEMFVLDDGWFGARNNDLKALGDWQVNREKLPGGIAGLAGRIHDLGLKFGLWVEPEMISPDSDLARAHPDWALGVPGRTRSEGRHQWVLDLSRDDVADWMIGWLDDLLTRAPIDYIKWDMNRNMSEVGSALAAPERQGETSYRYLLGLYRVLGELTARHPEVLFESCSGGGGRFDLGMLFFMPQTWTSDDSDAIERLAIQHGTSLVYPPIAMAAHVSAVPNHQMGRVTPLATRGWVAMSANFGYELDLTRLPAEELAEIREQTRQYRKVRSLVQFGRFRRLLSPVGNNDAAWMFVDEKADEALVVWVNRLGEVNGAVHWLRLRDLDSGRRYRILRLAGPEGWDGPETMGGDALMGIGLPSLYRRDFQVSAFHLVAED